MRKNLMYDRVMATISKFSPQIFETYFNCFIFDKIALESQQNITSMTVL